MRVPNTGLDPETRAIVREGLRLAENMLRNYRDPPGLLETIGDWLARCRRTALGLYRAVVRN
jgi:hypothetical protein